MGNRFPLHLVDPVTLRLPVQFMAALFLLSFTVFSELSFVSPALLNEVPFQGVHGGCGERPFDGSVLHLREYVKAQKTIERYMYVYQYQDREGVLVFRYDNSSHAKPQRRQVFFPKEDVECGLHPCADFDQRSRRSFHRC